MMWKVVLVLGLVSATAPGQLQMGDIGVTGFSTSQFSVLTSIGNILPVNVGTFGAGTTQSVLWDPAHPASFLVGGVGFLGRATFSSPGVATYSVITTALSTTAQMSFNGGGQIIVGDAGIDEVRSVDPSSGTITEITTGPQPWGANLNAAVYNPATGDILVGSNGTLWLLSGGSVSALASGWGSGFVSGITFDPFTSEAVMTILSANRVVRVDVAGNLTDLIAPGSISTPNSIAVDQNGNFVVGAVQGQIFRIPNLGGTPVLLGVTSGQGGGSSGVSVVGGLAPNAPIYAITIAFAASGDATLSFSGLPMQTAEGWLFPTQATPTPPGAGPVLGITPDPLTFSIFAAFPQPQTGNPFHFLTGFGSAFPNSPFIIPASVAGSLTGQVWDFVSLALDGGEALLGASSVTRVVWP